MPDTRKHANPHDRLTMYHDPSHGWLRVPLEDAHSSGVDITQYSFMDDSYAYLEEDCDAIRYLESCGYTFGADHQDHIAIHHQHTDRDSSIRNLPSYTTTAKA